MPLFSTLYNDGKGLMFPVSPHWVSYLAENLADLCDFLISCEKDSEAEHGNEIMKQMDKLHYVYLLWDIIVGECKHFNHLRLIKCSHTNISGKSVI